MILDRNHKPRIVSIEAHKQHVNPLIGPYGSKGSTAGHGAMPLLVAAGCLAAAAAGFVCFQHFRAGRGGTVNPPV